MTAPVMFWKIDDENGYLSQWYKSPFVDNLGNRFSCAEQYMMYWKAITFGDTATADAIRNNVDAHPFIYKKLGRQVQGFDMTKWKDICNDIVYTGNMYKFSQHTKLLALLLHTGEAELIEASPLDRMWGIGYASIDAAANRYRWGENRLGKVLMKVRSDLTNSLARESFQKKKQYVGFGD